MWDWRQLRWMNLWGWWPQSVKHHRTRVLMRAYGFFLFTVDIITMVAEVASLYIAVSKGSFRGAIINIVTTTLGVMALQKIYTILFYHKFITHVVDTLEDLNNRAVVLMGDDCQVTMEYREKRCKVTFIFVGLSIFTIIHWNWLHIAAAIYGKVVFDSFILSCFEMMLAEFDVLKVAFKKIDFASENSPVSLNFCIKFHQDLMRLIVRMDSFLIPIQTTQCVMFTLNICFAVFEMLSLSQVSLNKTLNLGEVILAGGYILFGYCYQCHCVTEQCTEIITAACDNNWYEGKIADQKSLLIFLERAKRPISFGSIIKFDLGCFIAVVKTAFSYYQVLTAFDI
ncbi:Odorant receptor [Nesidiocoris tenuis]|uniref:Odorant receptor n=1 Tax=Nesidiocoris tenuis TaxID=355587 RepID=A0ABN7B4E4_9HEMI|nr:Odorant receptor [Nesidiocoris tenuis]